MKYTHEIFAKANELMQTKGMTFRKAIIEITGNGSIRGREYKAFEDWRKNNTTTDCDGLVYANAEPKPQPAPKAQPQFHQKTDNKEYIPTMNGNYIARNLGGRMTDYEFLKRAYGNRKNNLFAGILIEGETGCGKTHFVRYFCHEEKIPYMRVNVNGATTPEDLVGQFIPTDNGLQWVDGVLTRFMRYGGIFVVDEINMAQADILAILNPVLDDEKKLVLVQKDGEIIHAHKDFFLVATMNADYEGTKPLNEALKDRMLNIHFDYNELAEKKLLNDDKLCEWAKKLRKLREEGMIDTTISTRALLLYKENTKVYGEDFAEELLLQRFQPTERKAVKEAKDMIKSQDTTNPFGEAQA